MTEKSKKPIKTDLSSFDGVADAMEAGFECEIRHPVTDKRLGITITVASYESDRVKKVQRAQANRALKKQRRKGQTAEEIEASANAIVEASIVSWTGVELDEKALDCTPDNIRLIIKDYPWIAEQVDAAADDRANFFTK